MVLLLQNGGSDVFSRYHLESGSGHTDEKWLQKTLFENPSLVPMEAIEPGAGDVFPLCRELTLNSLTGSVFLDILGITKSGRLCLIECKLWRNPQARREVIAQTLEYAALLRTLSYGDLSAKLTAKGLPGQNPIFAAAKERWDDIQEGPFVDAVSRSLKRGDFQLMVAGDGIRSDLHTIAAHLEHSGLAAARFSLVEIQLWRNASGATLIVPTVPVRTEVIQHRVLLTTSDDVVQLVEEQPVQQAESGTADPARARNRAFFDTIIATVHFDHPDQPKPRHGSNNWIKLPLPLNNATLYRSGTETVGFILKIDLQKHPAAADLFAQQHEAISAALGIPVTIDGGTISAQDTVSGDEAQRQWLTKIANSIATVFRPLLTTLEGDLAPN